MTERALVGPKPEPADNPLFPTPWSIGEYDAIIVDADDNFIAEVTGALCTEEQRCTLARFIVGAVNEKVARESQSTKAASEYRTDVLYWTAGPVSRGFYRYRPECARLGDEVDAFYPESGSMHWNELSLDYVEDSYVRCSVIEVPEEFRL